MTCQPRGNRTSATKLTVNSLVALSFHLCVNALLLFFLKTIRFKSYLLSMGIANPVTRETHGSGTHYHLQLAKQLGDMLQAPLEVGFESFRDNVSTFLGNKVNQTQHFKHLF